MTRSMDEVLERLRGTGTDMVDTVQPNHGPMGAEALCVLGYPDLAVSMAERVRPRLAPLPAPRDTIAPGQWREALGQASRIGDWVALFDRALREASWNAVLAGWLPRLAPGVIAGGAHGLIRTAHAVRSLAAEVTPLRLGELAVALGSWAADYRALPGDPRLDGALDLDAALARVPRLASGRARPGAPRYFVHVVQSSSEFPGAVDAACAPEANAEALGQLADLGVRLYRAHAARQPLVFLHAVTAPAALALLFPHVPPDAQRAALAHLWQVTAALVASYSDGEPIAPLDADPPAVTERELVARAVATGDVHAIKLTEACTRRFRESGKPAYLAAAADWCARVERASAWTDEQRTAAGMRFD